MSIRIAGRQEPLPEGVTGPIGYSACMISAGNGKGGTALNSFYRDQRVLDWDAFYAWITP